MTRGTLGTACFLVDAEATRAWYETVGEPGGGCSCGYCRNFTAAVQARGAGPLYLETLGVDLLRPIEVVENGREADGRRWYTAIYHLAGTLLEQGTETVVEGVACTARECCFTVRDFPRPCFEVDVEWHLPWVLEETEPI